MDKMIELSDLQAFLSKIDGGAVAVDLLKIGLKNYQENGPLSTRNLKYNGNFRVALDIEDCLDRFYGGYYSDWACGGQWNRAYQFVQLLANAFKLAHIEVIVFFDGTMKKNKKLSMERNDFRQRTISVLKHIRMIGTPPPKIWWLPPSGIKTTLRNALRSVHIQVAQTVNDHTMEIIEYFHDQKLDAIIGLHPDFIVANSIRYFSSHDLRLSYKGSLETKEFVISKLLSSLKLTGDHLPFVAVFLGGYTLIDDVKLNAIHECLNIDVALDFEGRIRKIAEIVRNSPTSDIDEFIKQLNLTNFEKEIRESVEYYQRRGKFTGKKYLGQKKRHGGGNNGSINNTNTIENHKNVTATVTIAADATPFASETNENDEIAKKMLNEVSHLVDDDGNSTNVKIPLNNNTGLIESAAAAAVVVVSNTKTKLDITKDHIISGNGGNGGKPYVYTLPGEVLKTSLTRHQRGIMDPRIYQLLTRKEIILPQILEDEQYREIPSVHMFYRPARQMIYAILFNLYHQKYLCSKRHTAANATATASANATQTDKKDRKDNKKESISGVSRKPPEIQIMEWIWSPQNEYKKAEIVNAVSLPWAVPTIQRLWFGMAFEDKQRRMKAFLSVMRSDSTLMLNRGYVPQHMLVMACILRYIVTSPDRNILTRPELDAFLVTAFSPQLPQVDFTQELVLPGVHLRGVYLATLFMQGVETASLANDACGVPLPWTMMNPWLFFDGKLFHLKLKMSTYVTTLRELCDDHIEIVLKIERFRKAILEDVEHFLLPPAPIHLDPIYRPGFLPPPTLPLTGYNKNTTTGTTTIHPLTTATGNGSGALFYNPQTSYFSFSDGVLHRDAITGVNQPLISGGRNNIRNTGTQQRTTTTNNINNRKGYQLKVGGIVTGSWASNSNAAAVAAAVAANRSIFVQSGGNRFGNRLSGNLAGRFGAGIQHNRSVNGNNKNGTGLNIRLPRNVNQNNVTARNLTRTTYGNKLNQSRNRNRSKRKDNRNKNNNKTQSNDGKNDENLPNNLNSGDITTTTVDSSADTPQTDIIDNVSEQIKNLDLDELEDGACSAEHQNGNIVLASDLANSMCDVILKDEEDTDAFDDEIIEPTKLPPPSSSSSSSSSPSTTPIKILQNKNHITSSSPSTITTSNYANLNESKELSVLNNNNNNNLILNSTTINSSGGNCSDILAGTGGNNFNISKNNDDLINNGSILSTLTPPTNNIITEKLNIVMKPNNGANISSNNKETVVVGVDEIGQGDVSVKG